METLSAREFLSLYQINLAAKTGLPTKIRKDEIERYIEDSYKNSTLSEEERKQLLIMQSQIREIDLVQHVANRLLTTITPALRGKLHEIPVGTLPTRDFNAASIRSPSGEPVAVIASGLSGTLFDIAAWYVAYVGFDGLPPEVSEADSSLKIFELTMFHLTGSADWLPSERIHVKAPLRRNVIGAFWTNAMNFVLGHEYAHAVLGHLSEVAGARHI